MTITIITTTSITTTITICLPQSISRAISLLDKLEQF